MNSICIKSGIRVAAGLNWSAEIESSGGRTAVLLNHPVFALSNMELAELVRATLLVQSPEVDTKLHLLVLAMAHKIGTLRQYCTIFPGTAGLESILLPDLALALSKAVLGLRNKGVAEKWFGKLNKAEPEIPLLAVYTETLGEVSIYKYYKDLILPVLESLILRESMRMEFISEEDTSSMLDKEIAREQDLQKFLHSKNYAGTIAYTPKIGKLVLQQLQREVRLIGTIEVLAPLALWNRMLTEEFKNLTSIYPRQITDLMEAITVYVKITCDPEDTIVRKYVAITLKHLTDLLDYHTNLELMFSNDDRTVERRIDVPDALGTGWTARVPARAFPENTVNTPAPKAPGSTNRLALLLKQKRGLV